MAFELVDSFGIDGGELDGISPDLAFCLGVEWCIVRHQAIDTSAFSALIHTENKDRILAMLDRRERKYQISYIQNDRSEGWMQLVVEGME